MVPTGQPLTPDIGACQDTLFSFDRASEVKDGPENTAPGHWGRCHHLKKPTNQIVILHLSPLAPTCRGQAAQLWLRSRQPIRGPSERWEGSGSGPRPRFPRAGCLHVSLKQPYRDRFTGWAAPPAMERGQLAGLGC